MKSLSAVLLLALTAGCMSVDVPGETRAGDVLKQDVASAIKQFELNYGCSTLMLTVLDTRLISPFDGHSAVEKWVVESCNGEVHEYRVELIPTADGGTDIGLSAWSDQPR